jgi:NAD(P)-dependent dehydrogenase (short-subunit alcohol dehydrogenase family)
MRIGAETLLAGLCLQAASPGSARAQDPETAVRAEPTRSTRASGRPDDLAGSVLVLCSEDGSCVTGQALMADEGVSATFRRMANVPCGTREMYARG